MYFDLSILSVFVKTINLLFSKNTHSYLGNLSDNYLKKNEPYMYNNIIEILNENETINNSFYLNTISSVSSWADTIKRSKEYIWTKTFHYIDIMECKKEIYDSKTINNYCKGSCITSALILFVEELKSRQKSNKCNLKYDKFNMESNLSDQDLLKFIIHFMEDFIEPMHLLGYERGGNTRKLKVKMLNGKIRILNLHQLWDSIIPDYYIKTYKPSFLFKVEKPSNYSLFIENQLNKNIQIACLIYPDTDFIVFEEYFNKEFMNTLFKNYHEISIGTFKYIFS